MTGVFEAQTLCHFDNAIDVLKMIKETKIDGKAILYPHIRQTPLQKVDYWDKDKEIDFLGS